MRWWWLHPPTLIPVETTEKSIRADKRLFPIYLRKRNDPNESRAGFISAEGKITIDAIFEDARPFSEGLAPVQLNGRWGAIDAGGTFKIPNVFEGMGPGFSEGKPYPFAKGRDPETVFLTQKRWRGIIRFLLDMWSVSLSMKGWPTSQDIEEEFGFINSGTARNLNPLVFGTGSSPEFRDGLAPVQLEQENGDTLTTGRRLLPSEQKFDFALPFSPKEISLAWHWEGAGDPMDS